MTVATQASAEAREPLLLPAPSELPALPFFAGAGRLREVVVVERQDAA